ncbi:MAG TPA: flavodoxin domain-containing protein [Gemmatimonadales bacterium]|nr:flavodoxin domain-containing protein [Gemmatimonadales bacterium]
MCNILIVYGTAYGQTERIVQRIASVLTDGGHRVTLERGDRLPPALALADYDGVLVAASILYGRHQRYIRDFVRRHASALDVLPTAFVSVSGSAASPAPKAQAEVEAVVQRFLKETGWHPRLVRKFGGAMAYTRYGWLQRHIVRWVSRRRGGPADASRDYDFTDWNAVDRFAQELRVLWAPAIARRPDGTAVRQPG